ncbi:hypothetical protein FHR99_000216 [Litorivivens lipolytica]|uniref:DUF1499 domain-containing protein n=1 Tax=Litorivivens lipolytica TaxID=1524264 RepID=A0A7W4Z5M4_9GAMM|nr:DUF1499 domain-containing protein [Litorivivens lipolytica]MBB3045980.1 hypothetical protein [Litorivivens lipolytica]
MSRIARSATVLAWISLSLLPLSVIATRWNVLHFRYGLLMYLLAALLGLLVIVMAALFTRRQQSDASRKALSQASLLSLPAIGIFTFSIFSAGDAPMIHNVTTAPDNPPEFIKAPSQRGADANPLKYTPELAKIQRQAYPELQTLTTELSAREAHQLALAVSRQMGWEIYYDDPAQGHIEAVATTRWFGFKDDIVIRINAGSEPTQIDLRSVSRVGQGDMGANARRIQAFIEYFREIE